MQYPLYQKFLFNRTVLAWWDHIMLNMDPQTVTSEYSVSESAFYRLAKNMLHFRKTAGLLKWYRIHLSLKITILSLKSQNFVSVYFVNLPEKDIFVYRYFKSYLSDSWRNIRQDKKRMQILSCRQPRNIDSVSHTM